MTQDPPILLASPIGRIATHTSERREKVAENLLTLRAYGYDDDDIWTLVREAINTGMTTTELLKITAPKET